MLQRKTEILLYFIQAAVPRRVQRLFCVDCGRVTPLSLAALARFPLLSPAVTSSPGRGKSALKGTPLRYAGNFPATAKSRPLGEGGCERSEQTEGVPRQSFQQAVYRLIYQFVAFVAGTDISTGRNSHVFCTIDISVQTGQLLDGGEREWEKKRATGAAEHKKLQAEW